MSYAIQFVMSYLLWVLLVWPFAAGGLAPGASQDLVAGIFVAGLAAAVFGRVFPKHGSRLLDPVRYFYGLVYLLVFGWACFVANLDVAYRVLHLRMPIRPAIVKVRTSIRSDMGKFVLANSITLTPGTLSVDIVGQDIYIHWINAVTDSPELRAELIVGRFEDLLKRMFD
jgi:multicomponent Na+:H+ antiporter subunit E